MPRFFSFRKQRKDSEVIRKYCKVIKKAPVLSSNDARWLLENRFEFSLNKFKVDLSVLDAFSKGEIVKLMFNASEMRSHIHEIINILKKNNILIILLKGVKDAEFGNMKYIRSSDIDILLKRQDVWKAEKLLVKNGYAASKAWNSRSGADKWHFHYSYHSDKHKYSVEIHWGLIDRIYPFRMNEEIIWAKRTEKVYDNEFILNPEFECIYLILSSFRDAGYGFAKNWSRISSLISGKFDWKRFNEYAEYHRAYDFCRFFFLEAYSCGLAREDYFRRKRGKLISPYKRIIFWIFFRNGIYRIKHSDAKHFFFLFLLYPNPRHLWYYFRKGLWMFRILKIG